MTAMRLALYQPDIPQNTGAMLRLAACLAVPVDIIEPCGFVLDDARLRRAAMDYGGVADITRHASWDEFGNRRSGRLILLSTKAAVPLTDFRFASGDTLLLGRESAGVPQAVHDFADERVVIPLAPGLRSLNVAQAAAIALYEALRQTANLPA